MFSELDILSTHVNTTQYGVVLDRFRSSFPSFYRGFTSSFSEYLERYLAFSYVDTEQRKFVSNPNDEENIPKVSLTTWLASQSDFLRDAYRVSLGDTDSSVSGVLHESVAQLVSVISGSTERETIGYLLSNYLALAAGDNSSGTSAGLHFSDIYQNAVNAATLTVNTSTYTNLLDLIQDLQSDVAILADGNKTTSQKNAISGKYGRLIASTSSNYTSDGAMQTGKTRADGSGGLMAQYASSDSAYDEVEKRNFLLGAMGVFQAVVDVIHAVKNSETIVQSSGNYIPGFVHTQLKQVNNILIWARDEIGCNVPLSNEQVDSLLIS